MLGRFSHSLRALPHRRTLHQGEVEFLGREFGTSLDLTPMRLAGGGQPLGRGAWQPVGALIQMHDTCFEDNDPQQPLRTTAYPVFAHEALHVWQRRHRHHRVNVSIDGLWLGITQGRRAYAYDASLLDPQALLAHFLACNIEQQGQIFQDYVHSNILDPDDRAPQFAAIARYVQAQTVG
jgi:hypothetical protein